MSHRNHYEEKKKAKAYRREMEQLAARDHELVASAMKPKPNWVPWKVWLWGASFFIRLKKSK